MRSSVARRLDLLFSTFVLTHSAGVFVSARSCCRRGHPQHRLPAGGIGPRHPRALRIGGSGGITRQHCAHTPRPLAFERRYVRRWLHVAGCGAWHSSRRPAAGRRCCRRQGGATAHQHQQWAQQLQGRHGPGHTEGDEQAGARETHEAQLQACLCGATGAECAAAQVCTLSAAGVGVEMGCEAQQVGRREGTCKG